MGIIIAAPASCEARVAIGFLHAGQNMADYMAPGTTVTLGFNVKC